MAIASTVADLQPHNNTFLSGTEGSGGWWAHCEQQDEAGHVYFCFSVYQMETPAWLLTAQCAVTVLCFQNELNKVLLSSGLLPVAFVLFPTAGNTGVYTGTP